MTLSKNQNLALLKKSEKRLNRYCKMGLDSQIAMPFVVNELHHYIESDLNMFFWLDEQCQITNLYDESPLASVSKRFLENYYHQHITSKLKECANIFKKNNHVLKISEFGSIIPDTDQNDFGLIISVWKEDIKCYGIMVLIRTNKYGIFNDNEIKRAKKISATLAFLFDKPKAFETKFIGSKNARDLAVVIANNQGHIKNLSDNAGNFLFLTTNSRISNRIKNKFIDQVKLPPSVEKLCKKASHKIERNNNEDFVWKHSNQWGEFTYRALKVDALKDVDSSDSLLSISVERDIPVQQYLTEKFEVHELSPREHQIGIWIALGFQILEIAELLNVSKNTVITHRQNLYRKMNVKNRSELIRTLFI